MSKAKPCLLSGPNGETLHFASLLAACEHLKVAPRVAKAMLANGRAHISGWQLELAVNAPPPPKTKRRSCLRCQKGFSSWGAGNRLCEKCRGDIGRGAVGAEYPAVAQPGDQKDIERACDKYMATQSKKRKESWGWGTGPDPTRKST